MLIRILVVDDAENWREVFRDILLGMNYEVDAVGGFSEAQVLLSKKQYHLVLLDICLNPSDPCYVPFQMSSMFLQRNYPDLPILAVSGEPVKPSFMYRLEKQGIDDFISKHELILEDLQKRIEALIRGSGKISILFLAADPTDKSRLRLGEEFREIDEQLKIAKLRDRFKLEKPEFSARTQNISGALLDLQPHIVHFSGHGTSIGALCFENQVGETQLVQPDALASLFEQFAEHVECVLLNACYSEIQAEAIAKHIHYVIGMSRPIGDKAAIAFSMGFYQALGAGRTIEESYNMGIVQIRLQGIPEHLTPVLIKKEGVPESKSMAGRDRINLARMK